MRVPILPLVGALKEGFEPDGTPNEVMHGRVETELTFSVFLFITIFANVTVTLKCRVYQNLNSMIIMTAMTLN